MRGTDSHTLLVQDVLMPTERVTAAAPFPLGDLMPYAITTLGPVVGAACGALDAMFTSNRKPFMTSYSRMDESPGARHWLATAPHLVNRAENTMLAVAGGAHTSELSEADGPRLHMDLADATRVCRTPLEQHRSSAWGRIDTRTAVVRPESRSE
ncbi:hypothetical protein ACIREM_11290 [Streptomyces shenzhenensis]|uniref:hypothetical protein n=1 Tax=Streptomyces shenzhenensis TaxID=943815 RepID=UPI003828AED4